MKKIYLYAIGIILGITSCTGDLNTFPLTSQTVLPEEAWKNPESYNEFTAKIYSAFSISGNNGAASGDIVGADQGEATFTRAYWNLQELPTDEAVMAWSDDGLNGLQFDNWVASNRFVQLNYNRMNLINAYCNEFLINTTDDALNSRGVSDAKLDSVHEMRAEVRALRAFSYYILMDFYANVPFTDETTGIGTYLPEQKGRDFLFPWIESELKDVIDQLPAKSTANYGKINRYVVDMILANLYMNAEVYGQGARYTDAITYLNDVINNGGFSLENNYQWNFNADNDLSAEVIFPIVYDGNYAQSYGGTTYLMAGAFGSDMNPATNFGIAQSWSGMRAPQDLSNLFVETDKRALFWKTDRTLEATTWGDYTQGYAITKFTNLTRSGDAGSNATFADGDWVFYRLADAYLLYVEAVMRGGQGGSEATAVSLYNQIEERAFGDDSHNITALTDITFSTLLDERARELYWEGKRRTDLIRFDCFTDNKNWTWKNGVYAGTQRLDDKFNLYPIPSTDLSANPNLKQNTGY